MINKIVVHCSDTPDDREVSAADIHSWHLQNGWSGIGYHYVITRTGLIENGRPDYWKGSHAKGNNNNSLGICMVGRDSFTDNQYKTLEITLLQLRAKHDNPDLFGHCELDSGKTCPNQEVMEFINQYRTRILGEMK